MYFKYVQLNIYRQSLGLVMPTQILLSTGGKKICQTILAIAQTYSPEVWIPRRPVRRRTRRPRRRTTRRTGTDRGGTSCGHERPSRPYGTGTVGATWTAAVAVVGTARRVWSRCRRATTTGGDVRAGNESRDHGTAGNKSARVHESVSRRRRPDVRAFTSHKPVIAAAEVLTAAAAVGAKSHSPPRR